MADQIVSWGGIDSKGTSGMGVTGSFQVSSSANSFFVGGGNVGIGTPTPSASLHISGSSGSVLLEVDSNSQQNILYVSGSGRVGIGTSTPSYNLEVSSTGYTGLGIMSGENSIAEIHFQNRGYSVPRWTIRTSGTPNGSSGNLTFQRLASTFPLSITSGDNILVGVGTDIGARLGVRGSGTTSATTALLVQNANASGSMVVLDNGNVGIGIAAPLKPLHINTNNNDTTLSFRISNDNAGGRAGLTFNLPNNTNQNWSIGASDTRAFVIADGVSLQSNPSLTIIPGGNVGIGTTTPSASLHISGSSGSVLLEVDSNSQQNILYVSGSGNIGVGTSSPAYKLDVNGVARVGASGFSGQLYIKGSVGLGQYVYLDDGATVWSLVGGSNYAIQENGINRFSVRAGGNVGIGITTPSQTTSRLQVRGSGTTSATTSFRVENANASGSMVVLDNGNVGIGTSTPSSSLHISGASAVLTLSPQDPLPSGVPTGSFAVSSSAPPKPYFYDGTTWNALY
jgi:hypothetical protein